MAVDSSGKIVRKHRHRTIRVRQIKFSIRSSHNATSAKAAEKIDRARRRQHLQQPFAALATSEREDRKCHAVRNKLSVAECNTVLALPIDKVPRCPNLTRSPQHITNRKARTQVPSTYTEPTRFLRQLIGFGETLAGQCEFDLDGCRNAFYRNQPHAAGHCKAVRVTIISMHDAVLLTAAPTRIRVEAVDHLARGDRILRAEARSKPSEDSALYLRSAVPCMVEKTCPRSLDAERSRFG
jgi:hypothetical protein